MAQRVRVTTTTRQRRIPSGSEKCHICHGTGIVKKQTHRRKKK